MSNGIKVSKPDSLSNLKHLLDMYNKIDSNNKIKNERNVARTSSNLTNLINLTTDLNTMENLGTKVNNADINFDNLGYDEEGDIVKTIYNEKYNIMLDAQDAYDSLQKLNLNITTQEGFKNTTEKVLDMNWAEVNKNMQDLFLLNNKLDKGMALNMKFKGSDTLAPESLKAIAGQYQGIYQKKFQLLAQANSFDIPDAQLMEFNEEFGVALMTYTPEAFSQFMYRHQTDIQRKYKDAETKANSFYRNMVNAIEQGGQSEAGVDMEAFGVAPGTLMKASQYEKRFKEYQQLAGQYNERHKLFYEDYFSDNKMFILSSVDGGNDSSEDFLNNLTNQLESAQKEDKNVEEEVIDDDPVGISPLSGLRKEREKIFGESISSQERPKPPKDTPEYQGNLDFEFIKNEASKKNITKEWSKSPKMYNDSIKGYIEKSLKNKDITEILKFGEEMEAMGIDLSKKGAFPGLKKELEGLMPKIYELVYNESLSPKFRKSYIKSINKAFKWANIYINPEEFETIKVTSKK